MRREREGEKNANCGHREHVKQETNPNQGFFRVSKGGSLCLSV